VRELHADARDPGRRRRCQGSGDDETVDVSLSAEKCGELKRRELL
jgi:hypothetical protein